MINTLMDEMIAYYKGDPKRIQHFLKVYTLGHQIALREGFDSKQLFVLDCACLTHDIGIKVSEAKYGSCSGKLQEQEGPAIAEALLSRLGVERPVIDRVCYLIAHHHTYSNITGADYQVLVEADFLVNLYEDNESKGSAIAVRDKIFKTKAGIHYINTMFDL